MKQQNWFALEIVAETNASEAVEFALNELDALGTEINNLGKIAGETLTIVGYFNEKPDAQFLRNQIDEAVRIYDFQSNAVRTYRVANNRKSGLDRRMEKALETDRN